MIFILLEINVHNYQELIEGSIHCMISKLESFLITNYGNDDNMLINIIKRSNLQLIATDLMKVNNKEYLRYNRWKNKQKIEYDIFLSEISKFIYLCNKKKLKPIFMKGIFLAADVYDKLESRISTDVDILINKEVIGLYKNILVEMGYFNNDLNENADIEDFIQYLNVKHLIFKKKVEDYTVHFEIHNSIINPPILFNDITYDFKINSYKADLLGLQPYIFSVEYNLVFLMLHFFKHLPLLYFHNMIFKRHVKVNLSNLHDIALLVQKHGKNIDWNKMVYISKKMMVIKVIRMVCNMVNEIYDDIFPTDFVTDLINNMDYNYMSTQNLEYLGLGKFLWLLDIVFDEISKLSLIEILYGQLPESINLIDISQCKSKSYVVHANKVIHIKNNCTIKYPLSNISDNSMILANTVVEAIINSDMLSINLTVDSKSCCFYEGDGPFYDKDSIEVFFIKKDHILHKMFTLTKNVNDLCITMSSYNTDEIRIISKNDFNYDILLNNNGFILQLDIPWSFIGIDCKKDNIVAFNISGVISNPVTCRILSNCQLFGNENYVWDFRNVGILEFPN